MTSAGISDNATVITHGGCTDGHTAAWLLHLLAPRARFIPARHDDPVPEIDGGEVVIADFAYGRDGMAAIADRCDSVLLLDHHQTAQDRLATLTHPRLTMHFDMARCGARMVMDHYAALLAASLDDDRWNAVQRFVAYVDDRDRWVRALPDNGTWAAGLSAYEMTFDAWDEVVFSSAERLLQDGRAIERARERWIDAALRRAIEATIAGHTVLVTNCDPSIVSETGGRLAEGRPFSACYADDGEHRNWSLRSTADAVDVARIAERFGGGGHPRAAGFRTARDSWPEG